MQPIERLDSLSVDEFHRRVFRVQRPVLLEGAIDHWPAISRWADPGALAARTGGIRVLLQTSRATEQHSDNIRYSFGTYLRGRGGTVREAMVPMPDALTAVLHPPSEAETSYVRQVAVTGSPLAEDIEAPPLLAAPPPPEGGPFLWIGGLHSRTHLHWDSHPNLNAQVVGEKRWILVEPGERRLAYPVRFGLVSLPKILARHGKSWSSLLTPYSTFNGINVFHVDAFDPDYEAHPRYRSAHPLEAVMRPGDLLFVPRGWLHAVGSLSDLSMSINWWFDEPGPLPLHARIRRALAGVEHYALTGSQG